MKAVLIGVGAFVAVAALVVLSVGIWKLNWFVAEKNADAAGQVAQHNYSRQTGLVSSIDNNAQTVAGIDVQITTATPDQATALRAQRHAIVGSICDAAANLNDTAQVSSSAQTLIAKECQ